LFPQAELRSIAYVCSRLISYVQSWSTIGLRAAANTEFFHEGNTAGDLTMYNEAFLNPPICLDKLASLLDLECSRMLWEEKFVTSKLQRRATIRWGQSAWTSMFVSLPRNFQYRLTDFGSPIGRAWMYSISSAPRYTLSDRTCLLALRHRLVLIWTSFYLLAVIPAIVNAILLWQAGRLNMQLLAGPIKKSTPNDMNVSSMPFNGKRIALVVGLMLKFTSLKRITSIDNRISASI
jgi:hypothetical protein